jgi:type IV pilus assembly protein PilB
VLKSLSPDRRRELEETASLFEAIIQANPLDMSALDGLREVYAELEEPAKLAAIIDRQQLVSGGADRGRVVLAPSLEPSGARAGDAAAAPAAALPGAAGRESGPRGARPFRLGDILVAEGIVSRPQLEQALRERRGSSEKIGRLLVRRGLITEDQLVDVLSRQYGVPAVSVGDLTIDPEILCLVPAQMARKYEVLPLRRTGTTLTLAMADPTDIFAIDDVTLMTSLTVVPVVASETAIRKAVARNYESQAEAISGLLTELTSGLNALELVEEQDPAGALDVFELKESADEAPVVKLVNMVLVNAIQKGASDIHWEPYEKVFRVRFRIDGMLHEMLSPPKRVEPAILSRLKIMANLDIAERRLPQDGRMKLRYNRREIDFRVSIVPTIYGEKAVLRILDRDALQLDLSALGFDAWGLDHFQRAIRQPYGMVLLTGPTGSGKTTTLYSAIHTINAPDINIMTVEDPVEYNLRGVNQVHVDESIGRTFAGALRSFLRQDPDVILVGETRDLETAQISIRAALTGHLVLSTLHTNDCPSTVVRLVDMGIPSFLVASSLILIVAQRLARKVCRECRQPYEVDEASLVPYGHVVTGRGACTLMKAQGCGACNFTGLKGRIALYEVLPVTEEIRELILRSASTAQVRELAQAQGMKTLRQAGLAKALEGVTTLEEVLRVTLA